MNFEAAPDQFELAGGFMNSVNFLKGFMPPPTRLPAEPGAGMV